jgi:hypothetical protein
LPSHKGTSKRDILKNGTSLERRWKSNQNVGKETEKKTKTKKDGKKKKRKYGWIHRWIEKEILLQKFGTEKKMKHFFSMQ